MRSDLWLWLFCSDSNKRLANVLLYVHKITGADVTEVVTQDCLLFVPETPKFAAWAVLGEGCSSARDPFRIRALLVASEVR